MTRASIPVIKPEIMALVICCSPLEVVPYTQYIAGRGGSVTGYFEGVGVGVADDGGGTGTGTRLVVPGAMLVAGGGVSSVLSGSSVSSQAARDRTASATAGRKASRRLMPANHAWVDLSPRKVRPDAVFHGVIVTLRVTSSVV